MMETLATKEEVMRICDQLVTEGRKLSGKYLLLPLNSTSFFFVKARQL